MNIKPILDRIKGIYTKYYKEPKQHVAFRETIARSVLVALFFYGWSPLTHCCWD